MSDTSPSRDPNLSPDPRTTRTQGGRIRGVPRGLIVVGVLTILFICVVVLVEMLVR